MLKNTILDDCCKYLDLNNLQNLSYSRFTSHRFNI